MKNEKWNKKIKIKTNEQFAHKAANANLSASVSFELCYMWWLWKKGKEKTRREMKVHNRIKTIGACTPFPTRARTLPRTITLAHACGYSHTPISIHTSIRFCALFVCLLTDSPEVNGYLSWESHQTNRMMKIKLCMERKKTQNLIFIEGLTGTL